MTESLPPFWKWDDAVSPAMCDLLLEERKVLQETNGTVGANKEVISVRNSKICWVKTNHWIESVMYNHSLYANELAGWAFQMGRPENVQLAAYDISGFYSWHEDWTPLAKTPNIRKISSVLLLSSPEDFEGGQFEFEGSEPVEMKRGTLIVFPSFVRHQVTPVTSGIRYSATCWVTGPKTL